MTDYPEESLGNVFDDTDLVQAVQNTTMQKAFFQERKSARFQLPIYPNTDIAKIY